jgi:hypothetical protein
MEPGNIFFIRARTAFSMHFGVPADAPVFYARLRRGLALF